MDQKDKIRELITKFISKDIAAADAITSELLQARMAARYADAGFIPNSAPSENTPPQSS